MILLKESIIQGLYAYINIISRMFAEIPCRENNSRLPADMMEKVKNLRLYPSPDSLNDPLSTSQWQEIKRSSEYIWYYG